MNMKFEEALEELKLIVKQLESENIDLDKSIEVYKRGIELSKFCRDKLDETNTLIATVIDESGEKSEF